VTAPAGFVRILCKAGTDCILGATVVAADAGNIISEISLAIETNTGLSAIAAVIHPYAAQHAVTALLSLLCCCCSKTWQLSLPLLSSFIFACSCHDFGAVSANAIMSLLHV